MLPPAKIENEIGSHLKEEVIGYNYDHIDISKVSEEAEEEDQT